MVTVAIQQPTYLPWMGYFEQIAQCDVFVFLDSVQFERHSWQNRNRLRTVAGIPYWLTVPVEHASLHTLIKEIKIVRRNDMWTRKHLNSLQASLGRSKHFDQYRELVEKWITHDVLLLADLNIALITDIARTLGFAPTFVRSSDLGLTSSKANLVADICSQLRATRYYSAAGASVYLTEELFADRSIKLEYQKWEHPVYQQVGGNFVSHLSIVDALMNIGVEQARTLILQK